MHLMHFVNSSQKKRYMAYMTIFQFRHKKAIDFET